MALIDNVDKNAACQSFVADDQHIFIAARREFALHFVLEGPGVDRLPIKGYLPISVDVHTQGRLVLRQGAFGAGALQAEPKIFGKGCRYHKEN